MMIGKIAMTLENITFTRKEKVLDHISFTLNTSEVLGIVGSNGVGKSTLLKLISNIIPLQEGKISFHGNTIGHLIENPNLYPYKTGRDHLDYIMKINQDQNLDEYRVLVNLLDIEKILDKKIKSYSLGMRQKIGILSAVVGNKNIVILDEPNNSLDYSSMINMRELLLYLKSKNKSVIITSHLLSELEHTCDRIILLKDGKISDEFKVDKESGGLEKYILEKGN